MLQTARRLLNNQKNHWHFNFICLTELGFLNVFIYRVHPFLLSFSTLTPIYSLSSFFFLASLIYFFLFLSFVSLVRCVLLHLSLLSSLYLNRSIFSFISLLLWCSRLPLLTAPLYFFSSFFFCSWHCSEEAVVWDGAVFGGRGLWPVSQ